MLVTSFLTLANASTGLYKEKGSKFFAFAYPVTSEEEVKTYLASLRKEYFDARHHCYAWILGADKGKIRANDDGEPNHSAGDPILGQIRSKGLTNVLVVVVRYFGGTKLGVGGLITAYKTAAENTLQAATIVEIQVMKDVVLQFPYESTNEIMRLVKEFDLTVLKQTFENDCTLNAEVRIGDLALFETRMQLMKDLGVMFQVEIL